MEEEEVTGQWRGEGRNFIRLGDTVKVKGLRGKYVVKAFRPAYGGMEAHLFGGPVGRAPSSRTVHADRLIRMVQK